MNRSILFKSVCLALLAGCLAAGGFFFGKSAGKNEADAASRAEREYNIRLQRSELDGLGEIEGTIYVTGHKSPDTDTVASAIACADLLRQLGYDAQAAVLGPINRESAFVLRQAGLETPPLLTDAAGKNIILVDHSEYTQSAEDLRQARILAIMDHHGAGSVTTGGQLLYDARPLGSTATILFIRCRNYGLTPDRETATVMLGAILSDTHNLQPASTTFADQEAVRTLAEIAGIGDVNAFWQEMFQASISYEGMTDEEIFASDYKEYEAGGTKYGIGCVEAWDGEAAGDLAKRMRQVMPGMLAASGMDTGFAMVSVYHDGISISWLVPADEAAVEILETAYGEKASFDGTAYVLNPGVSRKRDFVPAVTDVLSMHPEE